MNLSVISSILLVTILALDVCVARQDNKKRISGKKKKLIRTYHQPKRQNYDIDGYTVFPLPSENQTNLLFNNSSILQSVNFDNPTEEEYKGRHRRSNILRKKLEGNNNSLRSRVHTKIFNLIDRARDDIKKILQTEVQVSSLIQDLKISLGKMQAYDLVFLNKLSSVKDGLAWENRDSHEFATYVEIIKRSVVLLVFHIRYQDLEMSDLMPVFYEALDKGYSQSMHAYADNATAKVEGISEAVAIYKSRMQPLHDFIEDVPSNASAAEYSSHVASFAEKHEKADLMILGHMLALEMMNFAADEVAQDILKNLGNFGAGRYVILRQSQTESLVIKTFLVYLLLKEVSNVSY